ncbi:SDR family oxidoreductase [Antarcticibacterium sp. 1MA-6-2]|uniref:SDR family NAD(P)-dependent oxidoreductase n=1 Tax=Antarcticibacterium sp. 1MA-6-2 TaxID=2908210 RepID=UPI002106CB7E|nr:SDR family NAD(P)-dependent oxidoreductase [Antarcticibacterium sp. 1MA-6-2]
MDFKDKKILITGGSSGIGKAIVKLLIQKGTNNIAIFGRKTAPMKELKTEFSSVNFLLIQGDVSNPEDLEKAISQITRQWGELDILINNAGVVSADLLSQSSDEDIIKQINVNLT